LREIPLNSFFAAVRDIQCTFANIEKTAFINPEDFFCVQNSYPTGCAVKILEGLITERNSRESQIKT